MRRRGLGGLLPFAAVLAAALAFTPGASARDVTITSFDGTKIVAHWFPGKGVDAGHPAPTILEGPGWSLPGDSATGGGPSPASLFGVPGERIGDDPWRTAVIKSKAKKRRAKGKKRKKRGVRTSAQNVPVKMLWFCGGHGVCLTDDGPGSAYLDQRQVRWFDRYLRGRTDADTGPKFAWIADDGQLRSSDAYPLRSADQLSGSGSGTLPILPGQSSGALIFATQAVNAVNVPVPGPGAGGNVVGPPRLKLTYRGTAVPQNTWVYAQFVNPRNGTVLGNIATPIPLTLDGQTHSISRNLEMVAGRAPAGGGYTLQLTASSSLYDLQRSAGAVTFDGIHVTMPLGEPVTAPQAAVKQKKKRKKSRKRKHRR